MNTETKEKTLSELLADTDKLISEAQSMLRQNGQDYDLGTWVTIAEYVKRFNVKSTNVVSNWINRGIIPADHIIIIPELNNIRLIKAVPYHE